MNDNKNENYSDNSRNKAGRDIKIDNRQNISANSKKVVYEGFRTDDFLTEFLCKQVLERLGVWKTIVVGAASLFIGLFGFLTSLNSFFPNMKVFSYLPQLSSALGSNVFIISIILMMVGSVLLGLYEYKKSSTCPKCGTFYALKEYEDPHIEEVETHEGTIRTTTRHLKCENCDHEVIRKHKELIESESEGAL